MLEGDRKARDEEDFLPSDVGLDDATFLSHDEEDSPDSEDYDDEDEVGGDDEEEDAPLHG